MRTGQETNKIINVRRFDRFVFGFVSLSVYVSVLRLYFFAF